MKQYIQCYRVFLPGNRLWMKISMYLIYPLVAIWLALLGINGGSFTCIALAPMMILAFEVMVDFLLFGGITSKDTNRLEYLKTTYNGMSCFKNALIADTVRRFLSAFVIEFGIYLVICVRNRKDGVGVLQVLFFVFVTFLIEEIMLWIARHFTSIWINSLLYCIFDMGWLFFLAWFHWFTYEEGIIMTILFAIACMLMAIFRIKLTMKKARRSYYDE